MTTCTLESFLKAVDKHQLEILLDDGVYRHLKFSKPNSSVYSFSIVTWPGWLAYTGDMGSYVFSRLTDMFEFFRDDKLEINPGYWSEKCEAHDRGGIEQYSPETFRRVIRERLANHILDQRSKSSRDYTNNEALQQLCSAVKDDVLSYADASEYEARQAVDNFCYHGFLFKDFWEADLQDYTHRFLWCCYALVWGIHQYDKAKAK